MVAFDSFSSDDDEEQCPLCIEDMDITDRHFKPCPCGFQICQFCFNNIQSGPEQFNRCPACRRPYDEASIEWKRVSPEEIKRDQERKQRKEQERKHREREKQKDQVHQEQRDKKHLATMRVVQKNLVYVVGFNPSMPSEDMQAMLRKDEFFGQYGKIQKIVVNKRVNDKGNPGVGVYVTYARKEDAARCIAAVNGSINDGKYLKAAYGTTKYCSSYLRGQNCPNPNCMFLHEPGEEADSFNRHPPISSPQAMHALPTQPLNNSSSSSGLAAAVSAAAATPAAPLNAHPVHPPAHAPSAAAAPPHVAASLSGMPSAPNSSNQGTSSGSETDAAGTTMTAANAPLQPVWGKVPTQLPAVSKITADDLSSVIREGLAAIDAELAQMATARWDMAFTSDLVDDSTQFPPMFSLPMEEKRRVKVFNRAMAELDKLAPPAPAKTASQNSHTQSAGSMQGDTTEYVDLSSGNVESRRTSGSAKKHNSQHLLAHLMRNAPGEPLERGEEERNDGGFGSVGSTEAARPTGAMGGAFGSMGSAGRAESAGSAGPTESAGRPESRSAGSGSAGGTKRSERATKSSGSSEQSRPTSRAVNLPSGPASKGTESKGTEKGEVKAESKGESKGEAKAEPTSKETSPSEPTEKLDLNAALALLKLPTGPSEGIPSVAETLRRVGGELMQPPSAPITPANSTPASSAGSATSDSDTGSSNIVDDGPVFDLRDIPKVGLTGDMEPSVWAAIENHTWLREQSAAREKAFSSAKSHTKKRIKKIRV